MIVSRGKRALQIREFGLRSAISTKRFVAWATRVIMRVTSRAVGMFLKNFVHASAKNGTLSMTFNKNRSRIQYTIYERPSIDS